MQLRLDGVFSFFFFFLGGGGGGGETAAETLILAGTPQTALHPPETHNKSETLKLAKAL